MLRCLALTAVPLIALPVTALAASAAEIRGVYWHDDGIVVGQGNSSNVVGFWQTILCSNSSNNYTVNGYFNFDTKGRTQAWQFVIGTTQDGIVGPNTLFATEFAPEPVFDWRLASYSPGYWNYYGGNALWNAHFYMDPNNPYWGDLWWWENLNSGNWYDTNNLSNTVSGRVCA